MKTFTDVDLTDNQILEAFYLVEGLLDCNYDKSWEAFDRIGLYEFLSITSSRGNHVIEFLGNRIWYSEDDHRPYIEDEHNEEGESKMCLVTYLVNNINETLKLLPSLIITEET